MTDAASSAPAATATGSEAGASRLSTGTDMSPATVASSGILSSAVSASTPSTALLAAASASALPASSQLAAAGGSRPASGPAAAAASSGSSRGRQIVRGTAGSSARPWLVAEHPAQQVFVGA